MWIPEFTMQEILNALEDKAGWGYMNALKDHLANMGEERQKVDKETTDDYTSLEIYVDEIRGDFEDVVCQLNELSKKPRMQRKEVEKLAKYADNVLRNY